MNNLEITLKSIPQRLKKNYKIALIIFLLCICIGLIAALISAKHYSYKDDIDISYVQECVDLQSIPKNEKFYYNAYYELKEKRDYIDTYLQYFEKVNISNESRMTLLALQDDFELYSDEFEKLEQFYSENAPVVLSEKETTVSFYNERINELEKKKNEYKDEDEDELNIIDKIEKEIKALNNQIKIINSLEDDKIVSIENEANLLLAKNENDINTIISDYNDVLKKIAENDQYEIIYNKRLIDDYFENVSFDNPEVKEELLNEQKGRAVIYAQSIAGLDSRKEIFLCVLTFFILFGTSISIIVGVVYEPRKNKEQNIL